MADKQPSPGELLSRLSYRPQELVNGMIPISDPAKPSTLKRDSNGSSIGSLDRIPLELLHSILATLDPLSLSRVSRVSLRGKTVVESLPAYRDLIEYAPSILTALGRTRLIKIHTVSILRENLHSSQCVSCGNHGAFLFLPTCERCCIECLMLNSSFRVIELATAKKCFYLTTHELRLIPRMLSLPGVYHMQGRQFRQTRLRLLSVKAVKELAITIHGSEENLKARLPGNPKIAASMRQSWKFRFFHEAPLERPCQDLLARLQPSFWAPADNFIGMASMPCPSILPNRISDDGMWCRGCDRACRPYIYFDKSLAEQYGYLVLNASERVSVSLWRRSWSTAEFLDHVLHCEGAKYLAPSKGSPG